MTMWQMWVTVGVVALGTQLTRWLPFLVFPKGKPAPAWVVYLGSVLPCAVMAFLVVYCLKDVSLMAAPHGAPEAIAIAAVVALHRWKKNTLLSVAAGTLVYMALVQFVWR